MKAGRRRIYDRPVARTVTIELWMDTMMEEAKKFGIRPVDIIQAGLISIFKSNDKMPANLVNSFVTHITPVVESMNDTLDYYTKLQQTLAVIPEQSQRREITKNALKRKTWIDDFHVVKFLRTGDYLLIDREEYQKQPALFELHDDDGSLNCKELPRYYSLDAILKYYNQEPPKGETTV